MSVLPSSAAASPPAVLLQRLISLTEGLTQISLTSSCFPLSLAALKVSIKLPFFHIKANTVH